MAPHKPITFRELGTVHARRIAATLRIDEQLGVGEIPLYLIQDSLLGQPLLPRYF